MTVTEIKLEKRLPNLSPEEEKVFTKAILEAYNRGKRDAVKQGYWMGKQLDTFRKYQVTCSHCGWVGIENYDSYNEPSDFNYCPYCGTHMDGVDEDCDNCDPMNI